MLTNFHNYFTGRLRKKFAAQWHAHCTYYVATLRCKTLTYKNQQYMSPCFVSEFVNIEPRLFVLLESVAGSGFLKTV